MSDRRQDLTSDSIKQLLTHVARFPYSIALRAIATEVLSSYSTERHGVLLQIVDALDNVGRIYMCSLYCQVGATGDVESLLGSTSTEIRNCADIALGKSGRLVVRLRSDRDLQDLDFKGAIHDRIFNPEHAIDVQDAQFHLHKLDRPILNLLLGINRAAIDVGTLITLSSLSDKGVRSLAEGELRLRGTGISDLLVAALVTSNENCGNVIVRLLGELHDERVLTHLSDLTDSSDRVLPASSVEALGNFDDESSALLLTRVMEKSAELRTAAMEQLSSSGQLGQAAIAKAYSTNQWFRSTQGDFVAATLMSSAVEPLMAALRDPYRSTRRSAIEGLATLGSTAIDALIDALRDPSRELRICTLEVLGKIGDVRAGPSVSEIALTGIRSERVAAIRSLSGFWAESTIDVLTRAVIDDDPAIREMATLVTGLSPKEEASTAIALLEGRLRDENRYVRKSAVLALGRIHENTRAQKHQEEAERLLAAAETDLDAEVAAFARAIPRKKGEARPDSGDGPAADFDYYLLSDTYDRDGARYLDCARTSRMVFWIRQFRGLHSPDRKPSPIPEASKALHENVHFSVTAPRMLRPSDSFLLDVWAHAGRGPTDLRRSHNWMLRTVGPATLQAGTVLDVRLEIPELGMIEENFLNWFGLISNCNFGLTIPEEAQRKDYVGHVKILAKGIDVARISFLLAVGEVSQADVDDVTAREALISSAFASYASQDRQHVLTIIKGMLDVLPDLDIFLDVFSLRAGESWRQRIEEEISAREAFYLFWSSAARNSEEVEWEWRKALEVKGLNGIHPVSIEPLEEVPPPTELNELHFSDRFFNTTSKSSFDGL